MASGCVLPSWQDQIQGSRAALVMVDFQNDFVHPDGWVATQQVPGFLGDTGVAGALARAGVLLGAARDADLPVFFIRMLGDEKYLSGPLRALYQRNHGHARPACVAEGTWARTSTARCDLTVGATSS